MSLIKYFCGCISDNITQLCKKHGEKIMFQRPCTYLGHYVSCIRITCDIQSNQMYVPVHDLRITLHECIKDNYGFVEKLVKKPLTKECGSFWSLEIEAAKIIYPDELLEWKKENMTLILESKDLSGNIIYKLPNSIFI